MQKLIVGLLTAIIGGVIMSTPASSQEEPPVKDGGVISFCEMINNTPSDPEFAAYAVDQPIDLVVAYETPEPVVLSFFLLDGERLNEQSTTDIQWVPHNPGEFTVIPEFFDADGNRLNVTDESRCSLSIQVTESGFGSGSVVAAGPKRNPAATPAISQTRTTETATPVIIMLGVCLIGLGYCLVVMFNKQHR